MRFETPPPPQDATKNIWLEINHRVSQYGSDDVLATITDESWELWNSLHTVEVENKSDRFQNSVLRLWQISLIAKIALAHHVDSSANKLTRNILNDWYTMLDSRKFFRLDERDGDLIHELLFRREMAPFDKDAPVEMARFSLLFGSDPIFDQEDCIANAPWERRIGLPLSKVSAVVQILRIVAVNDFRSLYPLNFDQVKGAIPPVLKWWNLLNGAIAKYRDDFGITPSDVELFIDKNCLSTNLEPTGNDPDPFSVNPLLEKPFVRLSNGTVLLPIIPFLHNVATEGLYYRWLDDPEYGLSGTVHKNGIQEALGTRFAVYSRELLKIGSTNTITCWTDFCECPRAHRSEGADFVLYSPEGKNEDSCDLIIETKSKRFTSSFLANLLSDHPRNITEAEKIKLEDVLGHAVTQINERSIEEPNRRALGLIVYLSPLIGANTLLNKESHRKVFHLPKQQVPIYIISSRDLELVLSIQDFDLVVKFLESISKDEIWRELEFMDGLGIHSGAHFSHVANNICAGMHECQHDNPCEEMFPCLYLRDNPLLKAEMEKLHLNQIS